jgi:large subunit ribosomal protein L21
MYAIVDIAGQQLKVEENQKIFVNRLEGKEGSKVDFDKVLLVDNDGKIQVGTPTVGNIIVSATILAHLRGDTIKVFKKKRRKGYQKLNGHRQYLTQLQIESIGEGTIKAKAATKKISEPKAEVIADVTVEAKPNVSAAKLQKAGTKAEPKAADSKKEPKAKVEGKTTKTTAAKKPAEPKAKAAKETPAKKKAVAAKAEKKTTTTTKSKSKK